MRDTRCAIRVMRYALSAYTRAYFLTAIQLAKAFITATAKNSKPKIFIKLLLK